MTTTLGINSYFEHPSVALLRDGEVLFAAEDERFTGIKHGRRYSPYRAYLPVDAMYRACVDTGVAIEEVSEIAYSYDKWRHLASLWGCATGRRTDSFLDEMAGFNSLLHFRRAMVNGFEVPDRYRSTLDLDRLAAVRYREWPHHLCHAASAFSSSGFDAALVVVSDGAGESCALSVYEGKGEQLRRIGAVALPHSLGMYYSLVTRHLGFDAFADEFKVMGMAAYGEPRYRAACQQLVALLPRGRYRVDQQLLSRLDTVLGPARRPGEAMERRHFDAAFSVQERLEQAAEHVVRYHLRRTGHSDLCLAGGTFLNCVVNGRLARLPEVEQIFVPPAAHDAGTALGAAALSAGRAGGVVRIGGPGAALGTGYSASHLRRVCADAGVAFREPLEGAVVDELARRLAAGEIVAVFRGRMEFGPRALGNRSILAAANSPEMRERLNHMKRRESFRPVAPMIATESFDQYFDGVRSPAMLYTSTARQAALEQVPAAVHVDGTARVQSVSAQDDPWMHRLLNRVGDLAGAPVLINTSLNIRGRPIVESPEDALAIMLTAGIDVLLLESLLVDRSSAFGLVEHGR